MANRNYIMLLLILGTISSFGENRSSTPDPTDLNYQNVFSQPAQKFPTLLTFSKLLVPAKFELPALEKNLLILISKQNENINRRKYQLRIPLQITDIKLVNLRNSMHGM